MPRRIYTYESGMGWDFWNMVETIASFGIAIGVAIFIWNVIISMRTGQRATNDPWDGATLEWATASPPPVYNFAKVPRVHSRRPLWDSKYPDLEVSHTPSARPMKRREAVALDNQDQDQPVFDPSSIHLPSPTFGPLWVALAITIVFYGVLYLSDTGGLSAIAIAVGLAVFAYGVFVWLRNADTDSATGH
jgi:cytochrome c oxidase subunit 1